MNTCRLRVLPTAIANAIFLAIGLRELAIELELAAIVTASRIQSIVIDIDKGTRIFGIRTLKHKSV